MSYLVEDRCEEALVAILQNAGVDPAVTITTGKSAEVKALPAIICSAEVDGMDDPPMSGNFFLNCEVAIYHAAEDAEVGPDGPVDLADSKLKDQVLANYIFSLFQVSELPALMTAAIPDLTVFPGMVQFGKDRGRDEQGVWFDVLKLRIYACGAALPP